MQCGSETLDNCLAQYWPKNPPTSLSDYVGLLSEGPYISGRPPLSK
jgi:hypothetical protein